jgi:hypothetical protein
MGARICCKLWTSPLFQMVGATRGSLEGFRPDQASGSQQPTPAPPNLAEVMARHMELLNQLVQAQMNQSHHTSRKRHEHPSAGYQDFLSTQPPLFNKADKPLDADAWLRTIESKFALLSAPWSDATKALSQLNNSAAPPAYGGTIITPCNQPVMLSHGTNSGPLSERTTF